MPKQSTDPANQITTWKLASWFLHCCANGEASKIILGICVLLVASGIGLLQPWPLKLVVDSVLSNHPPPQLITDITAYIQQSGHYLGIDNPQILLLLLLCSGVLLIQLLMGGLTVLSTYILVAIGLRMVFRLRCKLFDHLQRLSLAYHDTTAVGDSLYRVTWDTYCVQALFNSGFIPTLMASCTLVGIAVIMLSLDWMLTAVALTIGIPLILLIQKLEKPMTERSQRFHERESDVSTRVQETLTSIRAVQAYGRESFESQRFQGSALDSLKANLRLSVLQSSSQAIVGLLLALGTTIVVWIAATRVIDGHLTVGDVVLLVTYVAMLYKPMETLAHTSANIQSASASGRRVYSLLMATPDVSDSPSAGPLPETQMASITFDHVSFNYEKDRPVLNDICLDIPSGQKTALVGLSGAGKTTLVNLLPRFYDPTAGRIMLNGHDIRALTIESLRRHIGLVLQEPVLFCATIRENIAYGLANADQQDIEAASRAAGAHSFIQNLPEGYDTKIGERGITLSGGQRQRISIARAFLKNAPILIMDEPTSALDADTEKKLLEDLERLMSGRTTIIIAHRLSTIRKADRIVFMEDGRILEQGTHEELLDKKGPYARLYQTYSGLHIPVIG